MVGLPLLMRELNARESTGDQSRLMQQPDIATDTTYELQPGDAEVPYQPGRPLSLADLDNSATAVNTQQVLRLRAGPPPSGYLARGVSRAPDASVAPTLSLLDNNPDGNRLQAPTAGVSAVGVASAPVSDAKALRMTRGPPAPTRPMTREKASAQSRDVPFPARNPLTVDPSREKGKRAPVIKNPLASSVVEPTIIRGAGLRPRARNFTPARGTNQAGSSRLVPVSPPSTVFASAPSSAKPSPAPSDQSLF
jgi:hypothetical protein